MAARHPRGPGPLPAPPSARTVPILPGVAGAGPLARVSGRHGVMGGGQDTRQLVAAAPACGEPLGVKTPDRAVRPSRGD